MGLKVRHFTLMYEREQLQCSCGKGALELEFRQFGAWRVEKVVTPCPQCRSTDIEAARVALAEAAKKGT